MYRTSSATRSSCHLNSKSLFLKQQGQKRAQNAGRPAEQIKPVVHRAHPLSFGARRGVFSLSLSMYVCMCARNNKTREFYLNRQFAILLQMWRPPRWQRFTSQITDNASPLLGPTTAYNGESCAQKAHRMCIRAAADKAPRLRPFYRICFFVLLPVLQIGAILSRAT